MTETKLEEWAYGFMTFIFGIAGDIISFCVTMGLLYATFYIIGRYLVCQNDDQEWSEFTGHIRSGIKDLAEAFKNAKTYTVTNLWTGEQKEQSGCFEAGQLQACESITLRVTPV